MSIEFQWHKEKRTLKVKPLRFGNFLFPGIKTQCPNKQFKPGIEELRDVVESDDHSIPLEELISRLDTDSTNGLRKDQVMSVRERYGKNTISVPTKVNKLIAFKKKIRGTYYLLTIGIVFCLITAAVPSLRQPGSYAFDNVYIAIIMALMIIVSTSISYWQESASEKVLSSFKNLYPHCTLVIRDGEKEVVDVRSIVVGDLVVFQAGDCIPADIRITEAWNLLIEEAPLVFKGGPSIKTPECTNNNPVFSQNVAFSGTVCTQGSGQGIVIATGNRTAYGQMMQKTIIYQKMNTPVHEEIKKFIRLLGLTMCSICLILLVISIHYYSWVTITIVILTQIITTMPDILYSAITACLYQTAEKMAFKHCLPKNYEVIERLGSVSVICCNKTAIITQEKMTVTAVWMDGQVINVLPSEDRSEMIFESNPHSETLKAFFRAASLCSRTFTKSRRNKCIIKEYFHGDQSEIAIMEFLNYTSGTSYSTQTIDLARRRHRKIFEVPFSSYNMYQVTVHTISDVSSDQDGGFLICVKGAVEIILNFCSTVLIQGQEVPISRLKDFNFEEELDSLMKDGDRIIGFCDREFPKDMFPRNNVFHESNIPLRGLRFLGYVALMDPPRTNVGDSITKCRKAGIKVIMMTADHPVTGEAIARKVGIISPLAETRSEIAMRFNITPEQVPLESTGSVVINGSELEGMDNKVLQKYLRHFTEIVFARINPRQKLLVVRCLQKIGERVAISGYTPEDTPAMLKADIGIGMSNRGCDSTRFAADIVLLGDNFTSIVAGIEEGRLIYENLRKAIVHVLSSNLPKLSPVFLLCVLNIPLTMGATFILFIPLLSEMTIISLLLGVKVEWVKSSGLNIVLNSCDFFYAFCPDTVIYAVTASILVFPFPFPVLLIVRENANYNVMPDKSTGLSRFLDRRLIEKSYCQIGVVGLLNGIFIYFVIMAQSGFLPFRVLGIANAWDCHAVNDLPDSYNQEWTFSSRKALQYTSQTGFFLSIVIMQWISIELSRNLRILNKCRKKVLLTCLLVPFCQVSFILFLMYTPVISRVFHFYPIKISDWILCLPLPVFYLIYEEFRRYIIQNSQKNSWLERETF